MDRKLCVLIYSTFSTESKRLIEYIRNLPYDIAAITGMTFLCADSAIVREKLLLNDIRNVPCLVLQYFNGKDQLLENEDVYKFISLISQSVNHPPISTDPIDISDNYDESSFNDVKKEDVTIVNRKDVMSTAMAMQKSREENTKDLNSPEPQQARTQLFPSTK